jgi:hypothetical protein
MSYATLGLTLRAPRVVIVFDGGEHWTYWARRALYEAGRVWGGAGFAVVPHHGGVVSPALLSACRAYDPDFVVTILRRPAEFDQLYPGRLQATVAGRSLEGQERDEFIAAIGQHVLPDPQDEAARESVVQACSPYRTHLLGDDSWQEDVTVLDGPTDRNLCDAAQFPTAISPGGPALACPAGWGGLLGAAVAASVGVIDSPSPVAGEPALEGQSLNRLRAWLPEPSTAVAPSELGWWPAGLVRSDTPPKTPASERTMTWLAPVSAGPEFRKAGLVVLGDTADDFALAHLWRLVFGEGVWLPSTLGVTDPNPPGMLTHGLSGLAQQLARRGAQLSVTSSSLPPERIEEITGRLRTDGFVPGPTTVWASVATGELSWHHPAKRHLGVTDQYDTTVPVPYIVDEDGTRSVAAPLPPPALTGKGDTRHLKLTWQVDVSWQPNNAVRGRGVDGQQVFTARTQPMLTWARSSRAGASYQSHRFDMVPAAHPISVPWPAPPSVTWDCARGSPRSATTTE